MDFEQLGQKRARAQRAGGRSKGCLLWGGVKGGRAHSVRFRPSLRSGLPVWRWNLCPAAGNNDLQKTAVNQTINNIYLWRTEHLKALMVELLWLKCSSNSLLWWIAGLFRDARMAQWAALTSVFTEDVEAFTSPASVHPWPPAPRKPFPMMSRIYNGRFKFLTRLFEYFKELRHLKHVPVFEKMPLEKVTDNKLKRSGKLNENFDLCPSNRLINPQAPGKYNSLQNIWQTH